MTGPLIVQSDKTILLEVDHELATEARHAIAAFAELERAPEHVHSYRLTPLGLWNARAAGLDAEKVLDTLLKYSRFPVPHSLLIDVEETMSRYGRLRLEKDPQHGLVMRTSDYPVLEEVSRAKKIAPLLGPRIDGETVVVHSSQRGQLKQLLLKIGWPAEDLAGYVDGTPHPIMLNESGWKLRPYQQLAAENFWAGGSGVVVLPCGAGKTLVGAAAMATSSTTTLILVTNTVVRAAVEGRAPQADVADRGGDRRVLRLRQGSPAGHDRHLPGPDHEARRAVPAPGARGRQRLGPDHLRRGPPAAGADLPDDGGPAGPPPAGADRHAGARGRPRGRGLQPDRAQALRRAVEGHRGPGLHRPGRLRGGPGGPAPRRTGGLRHGRGRRQVPAVRHVRDEDPGGGAAGRRTRRANSCW